MLVLSAKGRRHYDQDSHPRVTSILAKMSPRAKEGDKVRLGLMLRQKMSVRSPRSVRGDQNHARLLPQTPCCRAENN